VFLTDGTELDADLVVVGIGSRPATDWLEGSGVAVDNGIVCDGRADQRPARVGARGRRLLAGRHRTPSARGALEQRRRTGAWCRMLGQEPPEAVVVPYFWSDQYDVKIQCLGEPEAGDIVHIVEDDGRKFLAYYERDGVVAGVVGGGMPGKVMKARAKIASGAAISEVLP
jgi:NADPH-dependent 2,4-dienoyl-CoA reductase/sulfur reductase-like enzyme